MTPEEADALNWHKGAGLLPLIVQNSVDGGILMTGFVNREALHLMLKRRQVVLFSRTRQCLWIKGETSGNYITAERIVSDCDRDAILVLGSPSGPACHTGSVSCFAASEPGSSGLAFLATLEEIVMQRLAAPRAGSYTSKLQAGGMRRLAQKVGEEGVEVALAADDADERLVGEAADLLFHLIVLLKARGLSLAQVTSELSSRHTSPTGSGSNS